MAKTEITKILFRRGEEKHRRSLFPYGGLDNGEPGWTSVSEKESAEFFGFGMNASFPDLAEDVYTTSVSGGLPVERSSLGFTQAGAGTTNGFCDLWIGGGISEEDDIYIGGQSAEYYNQMRFISLSGTDLNHPHPYVQGNLTVGTSGVPYKFHQYGNVEVGDDKEGYTVTFFSNTAKKKINWDPTYSILSVGDSTGVGCDVLFYSDLGVSQYLKWDQACAYLDVHTTTALKLPVGVTDDRPGNNDGTNSTCASAIGMVRYNDTLMSFEGLQGTDANDSTKGVWSSLGGLMSKDRCTYMTPEVPSAPDANGNKYGASNQLTFITGCTSAGYIDIDNNLVIKGDIVAFYTSDERLKDDIYVIDNPLRKIEKIRGVEFDWKESGPTWVDEENRHDVGLIAQDVEQIIPEAVETRGDGTKAVNYYKVIPLLLEGIKELSNKIISLEKKLK